MLFQTNSCSTIYLVFSRSYYVLLNKSGILHNPIWLALQFLPSQIIVISISTLGITQASTHSISESLISLHILSLVLLFTLAQSQFLSQFHPVAISTIDYSFTRFSQLFDFILCISVTIMTHTSHTLALHNLTHIESTFPFQNIVSQFHSIALWHQSTISNMTNINMGW